MKLNFCLCFGFVFVLLVGVESKRKVTAVMNPNCTLSDCIGRKPNIILVHVKAEGDNDTLHHFWDFTGKPSVLLALTDKNTSVSINWQRFSMGQEQAVTIDPAPQYVYGLVIDKVIEFNDESDQGILNINNTNSSYISLWDTKNFDWSLVNLSNNTGQDAFLTIESTGYKQDNFKKSGNVKIVMTAYGGEEHSESLPHLLHTGNASQLDLTLDNLTAQYPHSRYGLRLITASSDLPDNHTVSVTVRKTMDDEHAPGVFTIAEMLSPAVQEGQCGGYLQWRPVVYVSSGRELTNSTETVQYQVRSPTDPMRALDHTLLYSTLGSRLDNMLVSETNVTFGISEDGFYNKNKYAVWSVMIGYGHPPEEQFSMLVTLVLLIGLGLPAVLILTGTVCIVLRRLQRNKDDLFLSR